MRLSVLALAAAVLGAAGCKPTPEEIKREQETREDRFRHTLRRHFSDRNLESHARKENLRREQDAARNNPALPPPTGTSFNTYLFDDQGFIASGYKCRTCTVKLLVAVVTVPVAADSTDRRPVVLEYICKGCGHSPYKIHPQGEDLRKSPCAQCWRADQAVKEPSDFKDMDVAKLKEWFAGTGATVKDMFELVEKDIDKPFRANVRYVRRAWSYDSRATVGVSPKAIERAAVNAAYIPSEAVPEDAGSLAPYSRPGFHRLDLQFAGEAAFSFKSGDLTQDGREREEAVRPWKDLKAVK